MGWVSGKSSQRNRPLSAGHASRRRPGRKGDDAVVDVLDLVLSPGSSAATSVVKKKKGGHSSDKHKKKMKQKKSDEIVSKLQYDKDDNEEDDADGDSILGVRVNDRSRKSNSAPDVIDVHGPANSSHPHNHTSRYRRDDTLEYDSNTSQEKGTDDPYQFEDDTTYSPDEEYAVGHGISTRPVNTLSKGDKGAHHMQNQSINQPQQEIYRTFYHDQDCNDSTESSELFAHRIKELSDREDAISKRQHERRHNTKHYVGGSNGSANGDDMRSSGQQGLRHNDRFDDSDTIRTTSATSTADDSNTCISNLTDRYIVIPV